MSPMDYALLYLLHAFVWFSLGSLSAVARGRGGSMSLMTSGSVAMFSFSAHVIFYHLYLK